MTKSSEYRASLESLADWDDYLLAHSGLPGPRGNIELAQVVAELGSAPLFARYLAFDAEQAPVNSPYEFLAFCGVLGLGKQIPAGAKKSLARLRTFASDPRWRVREAVAMALQAWGEIDMGALIDEMERWAEGNLLERRAAAAALCEPRLLVDPGQVKRILALLDRITRSILTEKDRKSDEFQALKKGMSYCWSVAIAASPADGKRAFEKWLACDDRDVRTMLRENLKKNRLVRLDPQWVKQCESRLK